MPIEILMPALSPTMTQGNLAKWLKKEGDIVKSGQVIAEIETDKATMEVEAVDEGVIGKILVPAGEQDVPVNAAIAVLLLEGEDKKLLENYVVKAEVKQAAASSAPTVSNQDNTPKIDNSKILQPVPKPDFKTQTPPQTSISQNTISSNNVVSIQTTGALPYAAKDVKASPLARRLAGAYQLDLGSVNGSGPHGRIVRADVEAAKSAATSNRITRQTNEVTAVPNNNMRKVIAKRLLESKQYVPHFYLSIDCVIDKLLDVRKDLNDAAQLNDGKPAYKISVNDMVIKAVAKALKQVPAANASWTDEAILLYNNVDVAVAVAIDGGLITPIVKNAEQKSLVNITTEMKDLAARARLGKLAPHEFQGGGFSISNLGMYGIKNFNAIINPPQSCILAVGASQMQPVVEDGKIVVRNIMNCTLSCDHRVVDGAVGAEFLAAFRNFIEHPVLLVV